jgi:hypothetical protein
MGRRVALQRLLQLLGIDREDLAGAGAMACQGKREEGGEPAVGEERQPLDPLLLDVDAVGARCNGALEAPQGRVLGQHR